MQTQTQLPGQVPGCIPLQDRTSMPANTWSRTWQSDADVQLRRKVIERILQVFQRCKPNFPLEWQQKIPDLVKHVEEALYNDAASKEEYSDMLTLEQRLQIVAPRFIPSNAVQQRTANSVQDLSRSSGPVSALLNNGSNMVPTPGMGSTMMPTPGFSTNMIPTPGNANGSIRTGSTMMPTPGLGSNKLSISGNTNVIPTPGGMGNFVANSGQTPTTMFSSGTMMPSPSPNSLLPHQAVNGMRMLQNGQLAASAGFSTGGMQMMPTPGLSMPQQPQSVTSSLGSTFPKVNDISVSQVQQQQFGAGSNGHMLRTHMNNNVQLKNTVNGGLVNGMLMNRQHLANGNVAVHDPTGYSSQTQFLLQQRMNQQRNMQMSSSLNSVANGSYAMNAADLAGSGNLYTGSGLSALGPQVPKLATSAQGQQQGIQQQQQQLQLQQNLQQQGSQQQQQQQRPSLQAQQPQFPQLQQLQRSNFQQNGMSAQQPQEHGSFQLSDLARETKQVTELQNMPLGQLEQPTVEQQQSAKHAAPLEVGEQQAHENRQLKNMTNETHVAHQESQKPHLQSQTSVGTPQGDVLQSQNQQQNHGSMRMNQDLQMLEPQQVQLPSPQLAASVKQEQGSQLPAGSPQGAGQSDNAAAGPQSSVSSTRAQQYLKQQRWLLFLRHASKCNAVEGQCPCSPHCHTARQLLSHIAKCRDRDRECQYPRCSASIRLLTHHQQCRDARCPVCGPVRQVIIRQPSHPQADQVGGTVASPPGAASRDFQPPMKRVKVEPSTENTSNDHDMEHGDALETGPVKVESQTSLKETKPYMKVESKQNQPGSTVVNEMYDTKQSGPVVKHEQARTPGPGVNVVAGQGGKPKLVGVSLTELFTPEQIRQHITSLRQWVGQSKTKAEKNQAMEHQINVNACGLCAVEKLYFEPPPIYCTSCGIRIKRNAPYYTTAIRETRHYFCIPCYNDVRTEMVELEGLSYPKASLEKRKHDEETEEAWVACDKCGLWQHQICALFNSRRNEGGEAEYTCPQCCMAEMEGGERNSLPPSAVLGAKDLPRTVLSDHLESRLAQKLRQERSERAKALGKSYDEVPGAEGLVVRVVSSVDKKLDVKQRFLEIFQEEDYPAEFPYKSKAVLLFQKIEGVEVCLYGMYVQEFGVECNQPNQRRIYLSYLDSVKYFRPEVKTLGGEALRTFVYHELLIAYLDYCKKRGFSSCYIWACPPLKGEDYILYCHPEIQKTPKSDKLREWYLTMLKKASRENIVVEVTNFYDYFFVSTGECKAKVTAARLPYFDGDYWPGAAEDMILQLQQEDDDGSKQQKKGKMKKPPTKRATKAAAQAEMAINASKDAQLMQKLGESIMPMKEDFIMVHMHHSCTHCRLFIVTGYRWVCKTCKDFQICERCYETEIKLDERERHPSNNSKEMHLLTPVEVNDVPGDTKDKDEIMESEFFDTRHAFLSLCQGNHYQYDTLRRAKHSSMMVLYHLHNPMAPAFVTTCCICNHDIETGTGWRCETCPEYDVCNGCYQKEETRKHPHKLLPHPSASERNAQNTEARQQRVLQLRKMLDLLVHASQCGTLQCPYPNCCNLKRLFRHGMACPKRIAGGCILCKKMWYFMQLHARACKESQCRVPRCKDLKEHLRRLQHQMESRRRAAVMEMMRQRAAETAGRS